MRKTVKNWKSHREEWKRELPDSEIKFLAAMRAHAFEALP